jgi:hypothetical protein
MQLQSNISLKSCGLEVAYFLKKSDCGFAAAELRLQAYCHQALPRLSRYLGWDPAGDTGTLH